MNNTRGAMPTDLSARFEAHLKRLDTRRTQGDCKPTLRERALMATFMEQITPTFEEYGKLRRRIDELESQIAAVRSRTPKGDWA